jgi:hypothetical protein
MASRIMLLWTAIWKLLEDQTLQLLNETLQISGREESAWLLDESRRVANTFPRRKRNRHSGDRLNCAKSTIVNAKIILINRTGHWSNSGLFYDHQMSQNFHCSVIVKFDNASREDNKKAKQALTQGLDIASLWISELIVSQTA